MSDYLLNDWEMNLKLSEKISKRSIKGAQPIGLLLVVKNRLNQTTSFKMYIDTKKPALRQVF